ncbi:MAG: hypothetical protein HZT40_01260 [Candidatus Thiothrix singaporensis]|uniref:LamG domain-containing protein n=1 Tax=Candidatus Thiothrix singaporensis TaxID=2799669 RepID=A0A7L6AMY4_9GAMM|nr:MAG: hypothetical protein HZT40_01260 [Candidatus Thiothrix singaporensis]
MKKTITACLITATASSLSCFMPQIVLAAIPSYGLVAAYTMNGDAKDSSGRGHDAFTNGVTKTSDHLGKAQSAFAFNGNTSVMTIPDHDDFSVNTTGFLSIAVWVRPVGTSINNAGGLLFNKKEGSGYVHWMGKGNAYGASGNQEWSFRIYSADNTENPNRQNRMSVYHFKYSGGLGPGSYVQEKLNGGWIHYVAIISKPDHRIWWYKNGKLMDSDGFALTDSYPIPDADLRNGNAPVRLGSQDGKSFFKGEIDNLYFYNRKLYR